MRKRWIALVALLVGLGTGYAYYARHPLVCVAHLPESYARRSATLTANVTGTLSRWVLDAEYRLNGGAWRPVGREGLRTPGDEFVVEMPAGDLRPGENRLDLRASGLLRPGEERAFAFRYDPSPVVLPLRRTWDKGDLEAQDGRWERVRADGEWRVRPVAGREDYDRLLMVTGAFAGDRRVETTLVYRSHDPAKPWGFGVLTLWGGHPDEPGRAPRRGWRFAIAWYYSYVNGAGSEFSDKPGGDPFVWVNSYRAFLPRTGVRYRLVAECRREKGRFTQRMKLWRDGDPEPDAWLELADTLPSPLPDDEYAVAVIAHRAGVEFGPVEVTR